MKKTILKRSVASTLSFLMAFSTAVPNSVVYAEETGIGSEVTQNYVATLRETWTSTWLVKQKGVKNRLYVKTGDSRFSDIYISRAG